MIKEMLKAGEARLKKSGMESPRMEAEFLLSGLLQTRRGDLTFHADTVLPEEVRQVYAARLERRARREPAAYIEGRKAFMGLEFRVDPHVLIPRPETELLVEKAIEILGHDRQRPLRILDVGTGSGCVAVSLATLCSSARVWATDVSDPALKTAKINAVSNRVNDRIEFVKSDLFERFGQGFEGYFDMIVANPPYVSESEYTQLDPEIYFEPKTALVAGTDGLKILSPLIRQAGACLKFGGRLLLEIGWKQGAAVKKLMTSSSFSDVVIDLDFEKHDRLAIGTWNG